MLRTLFILGALMCALPAAFAATQEAPVPRSSETFHADWRVARERLSGVGDDLKRTYEVGEVVTFRQPPPAALLEMGLLVPVDSVDVDGEELDVENLRALLAEARGDRDRLRAERDALKSTVERQLRDIERLGARTDNLTAELAAARDGRAAAEAALASAQAELELRPPLPDQAELLADVAGATVRAAVNAHRAQLGLEPFGGEGAEGRARRWAEKRPDVIAIVLARAGKASASGGVASDAPDLAGAPPA